MAMRSVAPGVKVDAVKKELLVQDAYAGLGVVAFNSIGLSPWEMRTKFEAWMTERDPNYISSISFGAMVSDLIELDQLQSFADFLKAFGWTSTFQFDYEGEDVLVQG